MMWVIVGWLTLSALASAWCMAAFVLAGRADEAAQRMRVRHPHGYAHTNSHTTLRPRLYLPPAPVAFVARPVPVVRKRTTKTVGRKYRGGNPGGYPC